MSFTGEVKNEISKQEFNEIGNISILSAILSNSLISKDSIKITTENASVARYIYNLIKELYNINPKITVRKGYNYNKKLLYIIEILNTIEKILRDTGLQDSNIPKSFVTADEELIRYYLKGVFLMSGSINDPKKSRYHLEMTVGNLEYANFISQMMKRD